MTRWAGLRCVLLLALAGTAFADDVLLKSFLREYLTGKKVTTREMPRVAIGTADLNGDGKDEVVVYLMGREWCGSGGCGMLVLAPQGNSYRVVTRMTIVRPPVSVLDKKEHGWRTLRVQVGGGGIDAYHFADLPFDGTSYASNPTVAPARRAGATAGKILIREDDRGEPLAP